MFKNAIETQTARNKFICKINYTEIPALCGCILTGNTFVDGKRMKTLTISNYEKYMYFI
jgi:hypothetical protein